jgi:hypothetical protein
MADKAEAISLWYAEPASFRKIKLRGILNLNNQYKTENHTYIFSF